MKEQVQMCDCGVPDCQGLPTREQLTAAIEEYGQQVMYVLPTEGNSPFAYTIGNAVKGLPELFLFGYFRQEIALQLLNNLGELLRGRTPLPLGVDIDCGFTFPMRLRESPDWVKDEYTIQAGEYLGHEDYTVWQVIVPDKEGRFPGEEGCEKWCEEQVIH